MKKTIQNIVETNISKELARKYLLSLPLNNMLVEVCQILFLASGLHADGQGFEAKSGFDYNGNRINCQLDFDWDINEGADSVIDERGEK